MPLTYSDDDIAELLGEGKPLPPDWRTRIRPRPKRGHNERDLSFTGSDGSNFRLIVRTSLLNVLDFSVILAVDVPGTTQLFRLLRHNGLSHEHTNSIERETFYGFHIHKATSRYQQLGAREDAFAEPTSEYSDFAGALNLMVSSGNFDVPPDDQISLF